MKLTILGGGGFRVPLIHDAIVTNALSAAGRTRIHIDEIALHDSSPERLDAIAGILAERTAELPDPSSAPRISTTTDVREALTGADFVFSAIRVGGSAGRARDERVALNLGLLGQETIGPGGLAYALRTLPVALEIARTIAEVAPAAWVINFTNPAGIVTEAMRTVLGDKVVGICDTPIGLVRRVGRLLDVDLVAGERGAGGTAASFDYVGLNHLGWLRSVTVDGVDRLPGLLADDTALEEIEEARLIGKDWVRADGALPNEYLFYYLHTAAAIDRITGSATTRGEFVAKQQGDFYLAADESCCTSPLDLWRSTLHEREATYMAESRDEERREEDIAGGGYQEVAMRLMTALATGAPERMILDVGNAPAGSDAPPEQRIVPELPADAVLEVLCVVDADGVHPQPVAPVELGRLGMMSTLRAAERKILEAALTGSRDAAWQGFSMHPLVSSPALGKKLLEGYIAGHPQIAALLVES